MLRCQPCWASQPRSGLVDGLIDALVAQPHRRVFREPTAEVPADLLRTPTLSEQFADDCAQLDVGIDAASMVASTPTGSASLRVEGPIAASTRRVAAKLTRDRRR